ncbi:GNAT family N-acetyltransferase [Deinococcus sp.]|uniref:GNAT family N-acetyltransferase n=1 Tax=Deinococcus sp. TaxID=47478 RepID=UPI003C7E3844
MIRAYDPVQDAAGFLKLLNLATGQNTALDYFLAQEAARPDDQGWARQVADQGGRVVGLAELSPFDFIPPAWRRLVVSVELEAREQGQGSALLEWAHAEAGAQEVAGLSLNVLDHDPASREWAELRGYALHAHRFASQLDLGQAHPVPEWPTGIRLRDMTQATSGDWERLTDLYGDLLMQTPDLEGQPRWTSEQLRAHSQNNPRSRPDWMLLAVSAGGEWLAFCQGTRISTGIYNEFTGVIPAARGQGLARALKLELIRRAQAAGLGVMRTNNHAANGPMLSVNRRLGFEALAGRWELRRAL